LHSVVLRYLDQVARLGSIRRAAETLNVASSAVNRQILKLEAELGVRLFERHETGVTLTAVGERLVRHARETLAEWERVSSDIAALSGEVHGEVRVVAIPTVFVRILPRAIQALTRRHPHVTYHVTDADPARHFEEMRAGRPDVALLFADRRHREFEIVARLTTSVGAMMQPDHPLAGRASVSLSECAAYPVMMLNHPWMLSVVAETEFKRSGAHFEQRISTNSLSLAKDSMRAGLAIGFYTPTGFVDEITRGELVCVPLTAPGLASSEIGLFVHRARADLPQVRAFVTEVTRELDELERDLRAMEARRPLPAAEEAPT